MIELKIIDNKDKFIFIKKEFNSDGFKTFDYFKEFKLYRDYYLYLTSILLCNNYIRKFNNQGFINNVNCRIIVVDNEN